MINIIWALLIIVGIAYCLLTGKQEELNVLIFSTPTNILKLFVSLFATNILFEGLFEIAKQGGFLDFIVKIFKKPLKLLFKNLDHDSDAMRYICANLSANLLGLGSAATPMGLEAMKELDKINGHSDVASNEMITFVLLNTCGMSLLPTTILAIRMSFNASITVQIIPYILILSLAMTLLVLILNSIFRRYA